MEDGKRKGEWIKLFLILTGVCFCSFLFWRYGVSHRNNVSGENAVEYIIGVSQANMRETWRVALIDELEKETANNMDIQIITTDATSDVNKQKSDVERLKEYGMDLLIISPCDTKAMTEKIREIYDSGIPVIVMDRAIEGFDYTLYLGPDNIRIGKQAGDYVVNFLDGKAGTVLELSGNPMPIQSEERQSGFVSVMEEHLEIRRKELLIPDESRDTAYEVLMNQREELEGVDVIFGHNDHIALGAYEALEELGLEKQIAIVGSDGFEGKKEGIDLVMQEKIAATISCPTGAKEALEYALDILNRRSGVPKQVILRSYTITKENAQEYLDSTHGIYEDDGRRIVIGYSQVGQESEWRLLNTASIKQSAEKFNIELLFEDADQSQERQIASIRRFIEENVDVIVVSPVVRDGWDEVLGEANRAGIPVVMSDRNVDADDGLVTTYIGADFTEEGRRAMRWIRDHIEADQEPLKILQMEGNRGASPTEERRKGFEEVLEECPQYELVYSRYGDFTYEGGQKIIREYLAEQEWDIDIIYSQNDDMALGAIEELKKHGIAPGTDVKIVSVDATKPAFRAMIRGELNCAVECNPVLGDQLMKAVRDLVSGKPMPLRIITEEKVYDESVAEELIKTRLY